MPAAEEVFKQIRAERKWFKNVRLCPSEFPSLPPVADESGNFTKASVTQTRYFSESGRTDHVNSGPLFAPDGDPPSFSNVDISQELAAQSIAAIAEIFEVSVNELREISTSPSGIGIQSLGLDSFEGLEIIHRLTKLGVKIPSSVSEKTGFFVQEVLECFLESLIIQHGKNSFDPE